MQLKLTALLDEENRKAVREFLMGEVRGMARADIQAAWEKEAGRVFDRLKKSLSGDPDWAMRGILQTAFREVVTNKWSEFSQSIRTTAVEVMKEELKPLVVQTVDKIVQQKLKDKTVWEAKSQNDHIRALAKDEIRKLLKGLNG